MSVGNFLALLFAVAFIIFMCLVAIVNRSDIKQNKIRGLLSTLFVAAIPAMLVAGLALFFIATIGDAWEVKILSSEENIESYRLVKQEPSTDYIEEDGNRGYLYYYETEDGYVKKGFSRAYETSVFTEDNVPHVEIVHRTERRECRYGFLRDIYDAETTYYHLYVPEV